MKNATLMLSLAVITAVPSAAASQGFGIAARVGSLGLGAEAALDLTDRVVVRGGLGFIPVDPSATIDELDLTLTLPTWYNVGVDLYLTGALRIGGGFLFKPDDPEVIGEFTSAQDIGGTSYTPQQLGTLTGVIDSNTQAPYLLIGFGKHTAPGIGLFVDLGVAFLSDPRVRLDATGGLLEGDPGLRASLDREAADFEADVGTYLQYWPILNLGLRLGVG